MSLLAGLPCLPDNIQLITARYIARKTVLISMRQLPYDCSVMAYCKGNDDLDLIRQFFSSLNGSVYLSNLSGTKRGNTNRAAAFSCASHYGESACNL
ncbi:unnamed protein product [Onchocerca ochengi]|nr:unnamed protein product [Onchocerca ochengi]